MARPVTQLRGLRLCGSGARLQRLLAVLRLQHLAQAERQAAFVQRLRGHLSQ